MNSQLKPCGHRLAPEHFRKITKLAQKWRVKDAEALRRLIDEADIAAVMSSVDKQIGRAVKRLGER